MSLGGGQNPVIAPDGAELFYRFGAAVMAVDLVAEGGAVRLGTPRELFDGGHLTDPSSRTYHVAPDGRFLMQKTEVQNLENNSLNQVVFVQNWFEELSRLAPVN